MLLLANPTLLAHSDQWNGPAWWPVFPLLWLLFLGAVIWFFVVGGRRRFRMAGSQAGQARLAERYAAGEIDEQEYRERLAVLKEQR